MVPSFLIRVAKESDHKLLTDMTFESKAFWNYPDEWMMIWKDELTVTKEFIRKNIVYLSESEGDLSGYFSIVKGMKSIEDESLRDKYFIKHLFIRPAFIRKGIGTKLINHALKLVRRLEAEEIYIVADPNSNGFFENINAEFVMELPSSIANRKVSLYKLPV